MKRGQIWTVAGGQDYAGKPRPTVVLQDDAFHDTRSVTVCMFTTDPTDILLVRPIVHPGRDNHFQSASRLMVDKITTVPRAKLGRQLGLLGDDDMTRLNRAAIVFLGLASSGRGGDNQGESS